MANELPYFRFTVQAWQNGKIDIERYELKGLFISVCGYYWIQDCAITLPLLHKKFSNQIKHIDELIDLKIIKKRGNNIEISFLNEQMDLLSKKRKTRQDAGSKGGIAKAMLKQKGSYKDKDKDKDKREKKAEEETLKYYRSFKHLKITLDEFEKIKACGYSQKQVDDIFDSIENYKKNTSYTSLYLTALKWLKKEHPEVSKAEKCPYTAEQLRIADAQKASGFGVPEWFDKKWIHLLNN